MQEFWHNFFGSSSFIPHGHCYLWQPGLVWLHILSDACIAFAYYSIPFTLVYFVQKRKDLPFNWIFWLFGAFIIACGTTHLMEIWTLWHPTYWLSGTLKAITALISLYTALELMPLVPQLLALPSPAQLEVANQELRSQIIERERAESQIRVLNAQLEQRVTERTAELEIANKLKDELLVRAQTARAEAETANRMKDNFLAIISHELRTPLNPILGWCNLLMSRKFDRSRIDSAIATIDRNARLQVQLIDDLLDVSSILQGKLSLNVSPVNLASVITAALETVRLAAEAKSIQVETRLDANVGEVEGDPTRLQQVMWNLLSNAIKFTPQGGRVEISLQRVEEEATTNSKFKIQNSKLDRAPRTNYAQIQIADTGKGISADFIPYIFDYFRQESSATTRKFGGLGLGLAIVRNIVEMHGGNVAVASLGEGRGSTFTVKIPLLGKTEETATPVAATREFPVLDSGVTAYCRSPLPAPLAGVQVLVVDDDADSRDFVTFLLAEAGATVTAVSSAVAALEVFTSQIDILISDIGMPGMDGYMLMQQIRALSLGQGGKIPAIALTAYAGECDRQKALSAGFQKHIAKPIEPEQLIEAVTLALQGVNSMNRV
ncbi:MAG: Sensor histidine kinase RcsC [Chroococcidiopsis cubana SAG 39.79]|uniref:Circadian input-output histidine kinase CikA n=1 Tax=Chroococcidiopsis cubana SAG 39.79 TaxID=388085 RepID=A0AB37USH5_9CYAN|nr:ATP-binding protein [Chroococcidiopsis cubana]MDZ4878303.1 Sensor histidine kinase RcsC [Chroococcidiopsis cubana SAG 39.79]PSB65103.1 hybrid sensor histidine kinase/response regulator [Chroococcidiopsis cubana CCALA 043]RUT14332.1 hypothetical protein DSM107010_03630 [Chroococcidiopsis cubana SAG 39.79]